MKHTLHHTFVLIIIMVLSISSVIAEDAKQSAESITWFDFEAGIATAATEEKDIIIDFYTDWCHWCHEMDKTTFKNSSVISFMNDNFIAIRVNAESVKESVTFKGTTLNLRELTSAFGITGFPSYVFMTSNADMISVVPGYLKTELFLNILKYINQQCYEKQISFEQFMEKQGACE